MPQVTVQIQVTAAPQDTAAEGTFPTFPSLWKMSPSRAHCVLLIPANIQGRSRSGGFRRDLKITLISPQPFPTTTPSGKASFRGKVPGWLELSLQPRGQATPRDIPVKSPHTWDQTRHFYQPLSTQVRQDHQEFLFGTLNNPISPL